MCSTPRRCGDAVLAAKPDVVIHQLTDLPDAQRSGADRGRRAPATRALRIEGTRNLMAAAKAAGAKRVIAQSIAFVYAPGQRPLPRNRSARSKAKPSASRSRVCWRWSGRCWTRPASTGIVLRYGRLYGPGTWFDTPGGPGPLTTDAAAHAALLAVTRGAPGIYNIAEDDGALSIEKARRELGFDPAFKL